MDTKDIVIIVLSVLLFLAIVLLIVTNRNKRKAKADNVKVKKGVRYTTDKFETTESGDMKITHLEHDIILNRGVTYLVQKGGYIIPGKYTILSSEENADSFNLRVGGFVRGFKHADDIVLNSGDEICAVSHSVILR